MMRTPRPVNELRRFLARNAERKPMRVVWKSSTVVSLQLRDDLYTVAQMLKDPYLMFFYVKHDTDDFSGLDLNREKELFVIPVARDFLQRRGVAKLKNVTPRSNADVPEIWIRPKIAFGSSYPFKGGDLVRIDPKTGDLGLQNEVVKANISPDDKDTLSKYELTNVWTDSHLVPRLMLCLEKSQNIDPLKEKIILGRDSHGIIP